MAEADHLIAPLRLHAKQCLHRRFNQLAKLTRLKAGPAQAGLSRIQRQRNLAGAFAVPQDQRHRIANQTVLLIDEVMTTGATLYEVAKTLRRAESDPFRGLVLTRDLHHGL